MNWPQTKLIEVADVKGGKRLPKGHQLSTEITPHPYIRARDIGGGKITFEEPTFLNETTQRILRRYTVKTGDIVITIVGANIGDVGYISESFDGANLTENAAKIVPQKDKVDPYFLKSYLASDHTKRRLAFIASGAAQGKLGLYKIRDFTIPCPPIETQSEIASILRGYDDLIENNRRRIALLEEAARQLYKEWFVRFRFPGHEHVKVIDGAPEGWEAKTIEQVCDTIGGGTPSTKKAEYWDDGDVLWFIPTDVTRNSCLALLKSEKFISEAGLNNSSAKMIPPGSIMMTSRASVGFFGINQFAASTNQGFISIVPHDPAHRMYLLQNLMWRVEEIRSHAGGATYKEISKGRFRALPILTPPSTLAGQFEEQCSLIHTQVETLHRTNQQLAEARDLLLPKLMNGSLTV